MSSKFKIFSLWDCFFFFFLAWDNFFNFFHLDTFFFFFLAITALHSISPSFFEIHFLFLLFKSKTNLLYNLAKLLSNSAKDICFCIIKILSSGCIFMDVLLFVFLHSLCWEWQSWEMVGFMASMTIHLFCWELLYLLSSVINLKERNLVSVIFTFFFFLTYIWAYVLFWHILGVYQLSLQFLPALDIPTIVSKDL